MALIGTIADTFDSLSASRWPTRYADNGTTQVTGGRMRVPCSNGSSTTTGTHGYAGAESAASYTFVGSAVFAEVPTIPGNAGSGDEVYCCLKVAQGSNGNYAEVMFDATDNTLRFHTATGYAWDSGDVGIPYDATDHRWWKLELLDSGTNPLRFYTSPDGWTWTQQRAMAAPTFLTQDTLRVVLEAGRNGNGADDYAEFDNVNVLPPPPVDPPVVDAGLDATVTFGGEFTRTATESGDAPDTRTWSIASGPTGAGATIGTGAALAWTPAESLPGSNDPRQPTFEEIAYEITSTAENSRLDWYSLAPGPAGQESAYLYIEDYLDGRGYTAGIVGFTTATGDLLELVDHYTTLNPANALAAWRPELVTLASEGEGPTAGARADELLGPDFIAAWKDAARTDPLFRKAQCDERSSVYWLPARDQALADEVGPLGLAILYDISVNHGPGPDAESFGGIVDTAQAASPPPSQGGSEAGYIGALIDAREQVLIGWGDNPPDGRVAAHRALLATGNLNLVAPFTWDMYGDTFTISVRPDPPADVAVGDYVLQYAASNAGGTDTDTLALTVEAVAPDVFDGVGTAGLAAAATGTGTAERSSTGQAGTVALTSSSAGTKTATGTGTAGLALDVAGQAGEVLRRGAGDAGLAVDTAGTGTGDRSTAGGTGFALALDVVGEAVRAGAGSAAASLSTTGTGDRAGVGAGTATAALSAAGSAGSREATGTGTAGLTLGSSGAGALTYTGSTGLALDAAGTGERSADGAAAGELTLAAAGSGSREATGTGTAGLALDAAGAGGDVHTGRGHLALALGAAAGAGTRFSSGAGTSGFTLAGDGTGTRDTTGAGEAGLALASEGYNPVRAGAGREGLTLDAAGTGRRTATGTGTAGLTLGDAGSGTGARDGSGTAGVTLDEPTSTGVRTGRGAGEAGVALDQAGAGARSGKGAGTAGITLDVAGVGRRAGVGRGTAGLTVASTSTAGPRVGRGRGLALVALASHGAGPADRRGVGEAGVVFSGIGSAHPTVRGRGSTGLVLLARPRPRITGRHTATGSQAGLVATATQARMEATT